METPQYIEEEQKAKKTNVENKDISLLDKLYLDIKNDICNLDKFWKKHKKTIVWILIIFILTQYIDIYTLGANFGMMCQEGKMIQTGGEDANNAPKANSSNQPKNTSAENSNKKKNNNSNNSNNSDKSKKSKKGEKANKGGMFQSFREQGPLGNIFGKFGSIFKNAFKILGILLLIAILGFLPIIIMIVLTYKVLSFMVNKVGSL